jgi:hypothetical protein
MASRQRGSGVDIITETVEDGTIERRFDLKVGDTTVPGTARGQ